LDSLSELHSSLCERRQKRTVLRHALLPVKTAQFTQFFRQLRRHTVKSLSLTESVYCALHQQLRDCPLAVPTHLAVDPSSDTNHVYTAIIRFTTPETIGIQSHITVHSPRALLQILWFTKREAALDTESLYLHVDLPIAVVY
jgi:hypothetical protein